MKKTEEIRLPLLAVDFKGTDFTNCQDCAISKAAKRYFKIIYVGEGVDHITLYPDGRAINSKTYRHRRYEDNEFIKDQKLAVNMPDNSLVKTIILRRAL